ncbi:MAG: ABC transporter ATP-binding protein [Planctomycetota bacterium]|nr:ABC transporter ATP-binding protein [Planctomycetota bacterium]
MIEARGLTKRFGALTALHDLTLDIGPGEVFGFIGPNGAGKSTTMKILACLLRPDAGTAKVCGLDIATRADDIRAAIGYMPDFLGVYDDLTVDEYLQFFAAAFRLPRIKRRTIVGQVLELTDLTEKRDALVDSLSRGMQQRLGVARVLIHDPKVLLLDEPASGLDPRARIEMRSLLVELGRMGKTLMVSSHILSELAEMCTCIGIVERGRLLYAGSIAEAYARTREAAGHGERIAVRLDPGGAGVARVREVFATDARVQRVLGDDAGQTLVVELTPGQHGHHFVIEALVGCGARIDAFQPEDVKLEDAFLKLTTGALQ